MRDPLVPPAILREICGDLLAAAEHCMHRAWALHADGTINVALSYELQAAERMTLRILHGLFLKITEGITDPEVTRVADAATAAMRYSDDPANRTRLPSEFIK